MSQNSLPSRYSSLMIFFHWFMLLLLITVYACIELRGFFPKGSEPRELMKILHFMLGISVLLMVSIRLGVRFFQTTPAIVPTPAQWEKTLASIMHVALYLFMFLMPLLGWLVVGANGKPVPFWGLELPPLMSLDKPVTRQLREIHELLGTAGYFLIGLHALAGLFHHYIKRDNTLRRITWVNR